MEYLQATTLGKKEMTKERMPDLSNATPPFLVDELGKVRAQMSKIKRLEGYYKEALSARWPAGESECSGENFTCEREYVSQVRLDTDKIRADMDEDWIKEHSKEVNYYQFKVKLK